jgi:hypothetical protein
MDTSASHRWHSGLLAEELSGALTSLSQGNDALTDLADQGVCRGLGHSAGTGDNDEGHTGKDTGLGGHDETPQIDDDY